LKELVKIANNTRFRKCKCEEW